MIMLCYYIVILVILFMFFGYLEYLRFFWIMFGSIGLNGLLYIKNRTEYFNFLVTSGCNRIQTRSDRYRTVSELKFKVIRTVPFSLVLKYPKSKKTRPRSELVVRMTMPSINDFDIKYHTFKKFKRIFRQC